mmetsp:Transcript_24780/g.65869  ORF Transcript_24780/g.65869 Transcript_24780/m.65869 type:complete len:456 (+) Transcript_24780:36-1403(+)
MSDDVGSYVDAPVPGCDADFDKAAWQLEAQKYGVIGLLNLREAMLPIPKPPEVAHFKFLICPSSVADLPGPDRDSYEQRDARDARRLGAENADRKGKGKGKGKDGKGGRFVQDMGKTEVMTGSQRGQWWRNCPANKLDVIVREQFSLQSPEIWKVPPGHYVQQSGPVEVFVSGPAEGLQRMPVLPRGWVTVDASAVQFGGPTYLEQIRCPRWKVIFQSDSNMGDIVAREGCSLESGEVAVLLCGTRVEQSGPQEVNNDGIVRMPIVWPEHVGRDPSDSSRPPRRRGGWVTCDASAQGGPKFFEPCHDEEVDARPPEDFDPVADRHGGGTWDKNRMWKVVNLGTDPLRALPIVNRMEPFAPGTGKVPPDDVLVHWLADGEIIEQVGHSKKMRGYMVMPVRPPGSVENGGTIGWVTRRVVDKTREGPEDVWLVEIRNGLEADRERRRNRRRRDGADD